MTKFRVKTILLRALLVGFRGVGSAGRLASRLFLRLGRSGLGFLRHTVPVLVFFYRIGYSITRRVRMILSPLRGTAFAFITHRHTIHVAMATIAFVTSIISVGTRAARAEELGSRSILYALVSGSSEELIEESTPALLEKYPVEYYVGVVAVSGTPAIDVNFVDEEYVSSVTGGRAIEAPRPSQVVRPSGRTAVTSYTVQEGDTVSQIADASGLSIESVLWANKLTVRSYIRPGDTLTIPPVDGVLHTVKKGDTVQKIAKQYSTESKEILAWNRLGENDVLTVGEVLTVPGGKIAAPPPVRAVAPPSAIFAGPKPPGVSAPSGGQMLWPVGSCKRMTQYFGWRHTGIDIGCPTGTAIYAAEDGIVEYAGWSKGYGNNVVINHGNGMKTRYAHASKIFAKKGDQVKKGDSIEAVGSTGRSTGPHLHFEVIINGKFKNPFDYVTK